MAGRAKILDAAAERLVLEHIDCERAETARRDRTAALLSWRAGLRVGEIAQLIWADVVDVHGHLADELRVRRATTKGRTFERAVPIHPELRAALEALRAEAAPRLVDPIIAGADREAMTINALTVWFWRLYRATNLEGCSSHSGRRTFITRAARRCTEVGASIEDVRRLAGHAFLTTTAGYIDPNADAKRALVAML